MIEALPRSADFNEWIIVLLMLVLAVMAYIKYRYEDQFYYFCRLLNSPKYFTEYHKSKANFIGFTNFFFVVRALVISLGIYFMLRCFGIIEQPGFIAYAKILVLYLVFVLAKFLIEKMLGVLFSIENVQEEYLFYKNTYKNFLGAVLIPLLFIIAFTWPGNGIFFTWVLLAFMLISLLFLGFYYRKNQNFISTNLFYFILYLCTLEIAPYYILFKVIE